MKPAICKSCGQEFEREGKGHRYCGSASLKTGCAYERLKERKRDYFKLQRALNSPVAQKIRAWLRSRGSVYRAAQKEWRLKNSIYLRAYDRARKLKIQKIPGTHTREQWEELKGQFFHRCALCGISEDDLSKRSDGWRGLLTKDHIVPISRGGSDNIENIQPLCLICNSSKRSSITETTICISGGMDPLHIGHTRMIKAASRFGRVVVVLNSDEWLLWKKGFVFMAWDERAEILLAVEHVSVVTHVDDSDGTVCEALERLKPTYFGNGGDRTSSDPKEHAVCEELGIKEIFQLGGGKVQSSSELVFRTKERMHVG